MLGFTLSVTLIIIDLVQCQFGNPFFGNQPQQRPQNQGDFHFPFEPIDFQQPNQNFGSFKPPNYGFQNYQNNFNPQNQHNNNHHHHHHHHNNNHQWQQNIFGQITQRPVKPPIVQPVPSSYVVPVTAFPIQQSETTTAIPISRVDERISQTKCKEYSKLINKKIQFGSLSLGSIAQDVSVTMCDASTGLIVGGTNAGINEFPHQAAIGYPNFNGAIEFKCGGSLISEFFILTAAHCEQADRVSPTIIRLGDYNLKEKEFGNPEVDIPIEQFIGHEAYNTGTKQNDIAVIKMRQAATFSKSIRPACLQQTENIGKTKAIVTGWGYTTIGGPTADVLQKVQLDIINNQQCEALFNDQENYDIFASQICAGVLSGGKDTCNGDSGGPLQTTVGNQCVYSIIGITSYGSIYCGVKNSPGVYTRVSSYIDWIESKVWK